MHLCERCILVLHSSQKCERQLTPCIFAYTWVTCYDLDAHVDRSEGFPNGIFGPWAWWSRGLARWESCRRVAVAAAAVVGVTWKLGSETVLVFGPESVSYERSRPIDRCILREISARAFFGKTQKYRKKHISNISRISENRKISFPIFPRYEKLEKSVLQYFQDYRECCRPQFPIFPGGQQSILIRGPYNSNFRTESIKIQLKI